MNNIKDTIPFDVGLFKQQYIDTVSVLTSPKELMIKSISHCYANEYICHHHYLRRKIYVARNVSYGLFASCYTVGVAMFGYPVWLKYPDLVPPLKVEECPELIRLCTMSNLPRNTESWFLSQCIKRMKADWKAETGTIPQAITSFCDLAFGFDGAIYKATNFTLHRITNGRPTNPGGSHGKWGANLYNQEAKKAFYVYFYDRKRHDLP